MQALAVALTLLHGVVMQGPTQPVCQAGVPCSKPAAGLQLVFARAGGSTVTVRTDAKGRYSIRLARGTYTVRVTPPRTIGRGIEPHTFTVRGTTERRDFDVDTGIR
jgi:hypothetical protein